MTDELTPVRFIHERGAGAMHVVADPEAGKVGVQLELREAPPGNFSESHFILDPDEARLTGAYLRAAADEVDAAAPQARIFELRRDDNDRVYFAQVGAVDGTSRAPVALTNWIDDHDAPDGTYYCEDAQGGHLTTQHTSERAA